MNRHSFDVEYDDDEGYALGIFIIIVIDDTIDKRYDDGHSDERF